MLIRSAFSANIKERRDCSTALFDERGRMIAQAEHIPVHLGAMPDAVAAVMRHDPGPDDVFVLNDPYAGGTHLPDITLVSRTDVGFAVSRAHHADVGGVEPGSMPAGSRTLADEGIVIPPTRLDDELLDDLVTRMRNPDERRGDFRAQLAAHALATRRLAELCERRGRDRVVAAMDELFDYSERVVRAAIGRLPDGRFEAQDVLEAPEGDLVIRAAATDRGRRDRVRLRRHRTAARGQPQLPALGHALGLLLRRPLPDRTRSALVRRRVRTCLGRRPRRLPRQCPPTRSGRGRKRRDLGPDRRHALLRAWRSPSGSSTRPGNDEQPHVRQRTLHVLRDDRRRPGRLRGRGRPFGGARDNVKHTDHSGRGPRARVPAAGRAPRAAARLRRRRRHRGGDGVVRELRVLEPCRLSVISERRRHPPRGARGGEPGQRGRNYVNDEELPSKATRDLEAGDVVRIETPGGGGFSSPNPTATPSRDSA